ncbi:MAG: DUF2085 domain-containing protein [Chloroflexota bacterium]|nr:DUF2085 domain-containing protein [Chloroflexota bacterium]
MSQTAVTGRTRSIVIAIDRFAGWLARHWLGMFIVVYGAYVITPFFAPILMQAGATGPADGIYTAYSLVCHQLPERSIFLFGSKPMYSFDEIKSVWPEDGFLGLRKFDGNPDFGYKVAWSDRMISFYGSIWLGALLFALFRRRLKPLSPIAWLFAGILPVGLDGVTHMINDFVAGTSGTGFRDTNAWLQFLTGNIFPSAFYVGDPFGSFNSDMRWITGVLFGLTTVWLIFPMIEEGMRDVRLQVDRQLHRAAERAQ